MSMVIQAQLQIINIINDKIGFNTFKRIPGDYLRLYTDPNYTSGFYTLNNIPPQAIEKIKEINF